MSVPHAMFFLCGLFPCSSAHGQTLLYLLQACWESLVLPFPTAPLCPWRGWEAQGICLPGVLLLWQNPPLVFSRLEVTLGLLVSGFLVTHLSAADTMLSDGFFLKHRQRYVLSYWEADFCFDCCHVGLRSLRYVSLLGVNHSHSGILLIASTLMNEKTKKRKLVEIGRSRRELLIFSGRLWISKAFPRKREARRLSFLLPEWSLWWSQQIWLWLCYAAEYIQTYEWNLLHINTLNIHPQHLELCGSSFKA